MKQKYDIAAYIWPSYHYEPRAEQFWPEKDGEWYTVRRGTKRFPGHDMPRYPLLGYQDEADPAVARQHVEIAAKYGVNTFIMDWYWYENAPCFERQLNEGLIPALEGTDSKFYLMWANHDATTLWDMHTDDTRVIWDGKVSRDIFEPMMERVIDKYFGLDSYYRIDGKPVFSVFAPSNLVVGLGGVEKTKDAIDWLRKRVVEKGFPGLHLQFIARHGQVGPETMAELAGISNAELVKVLEVDSGTDYVMTVGGIREGDYVDMTASAIALWPKNEKTFPAFYPNVSVGWDNTQRNPAFKAAVVNTTPAAFEAALLKAKEYADNHPGQPPLISINSWNEWTEGSYLLPDLRWGYGYLEAIRKVFL